jgi:pilus assembly protein CpaB
MRMKSLILIFIALGCGLVASIGISQVMTQGGGAPSMEMEQILVALTDIDIGTKFDAQNVKLEDWPKAKIPDGAVRKLDDVKDRFANARFFKGEPLHVSKVSDSLSNITTKIEEGYRVMPLKVDEDTVMKGIAPGDRVDVTVFLRRNGQDITKTGAFTILRNVRVFAINTSTERATDAKGEAANFRTVSVLIKPDHARELIVASQMGKIMLTLRRPDEKDELLGEEVTPLEEILGGGSKLASEPQASQQSSQTSGNFNSFLTGLGGGSSGPTHIEPLFKMELLTPGERKIYEWHDKDQLPTETVIATAPPPATLAPKNNTPPTSGTSGSGGSDKSDADADATGNDSQPGSGKETK